MKHILSVVTIVFCLAILATSLFAQEAPDAMKNAYGYDSWPGKTGALKKEPALDLLNFPGYILIDKTTGNDGTTYTMGESRDKVRVSVTVKAYESAAAAQAGLLGVLGQFSMILASAESKNLKVGDTGFAIDENNMFTFVGFVKNNITVVLKNIAPDKPNVVRDIASQIDLMI